MCTLVKRFHKVYLGGSCGGIADEVHRHLASAVQIKLVVDSESEHVMLTEKASFGCSL